MYDPVRDGVRRTAGPVIYLEIEPAPDLAGLVHRYWQLRTTSDLAEDLILHALPDACVNILLDQRAVDVAGVTALRTTHTALDLGRSFHYVGIQLFPGVWTSPFEDTVDRSVGEPYEGSLPLLDANRRLAALDDELTAKEPVLDELARELLALGAIAPNPVTSAILAAVDELRSVADMAAAASLSTRQLQRTLRRTTGFTPHDLLKVLRIQQSFRQDHLLAFADQSHYSRSFRAVTGYTPGRFTDRFDV